MPEDFESDEVMNETPSPSKAKKGKSKLLVIGIPVILIQIVAAYFIVNLFLKPKMPEKTEEVVEEKKTVEKKDFGLPVIINDMTINIHTEERRARYFVATVGIECEDQAAFDEVTLRMVQVKDIIIGMVMSKSIDQLQSNEFVEDTLKYEIKDRINEVLMNGKILNIYFPSRIIS